MNQPASFEALFCGGDRRSIGAADSVAGLVIRFPARFAALWRCLRSSDPVVRLRAADALEKISRTHAALFQPYRRALNAEEMEDGSPEVRWNLIPIAARLDLQPEEARGLFARLEEMTGTDRSRIVRVMALQSAADLSQRFAELGPPFARLLAYALSAPYPSLRARARNIKAARAPLE